MRAASLGCLFTFELFASVMSAVGDIVAVSKCLAADFQEFCEKLVVTGGDAPEVLQTCEEAFDDIFVPCR